MECGRWSQRGQTVMVVERDVGELEEGCRRW